MEADRERLLLLMGGTTTARAFAQTPPEAAKPAALTPPRVTKFVDAKRPETTPAEGAAIELELTIAADGTLTDAKVVASAGAELDAAALEAVRQFTFEPARKGDKPVPARIRYRYTFDPLPASGGARRRRWRGEAASTPAPAPAAPRAGRLEGRILSRTGDKAVAAATVTLLSDQGAAVGTTLAAEDGTFAFADVAPGSYRVRVEADGFAAVETTEAVTSGEATAITYRLEPAKKADTQYEFGATASIAAPPREVVKRTLAPEELVRAAGTRGDPLRVIELLPGVARPPGLAGFIIIRGASPFDSQAFFEGGPVDRIYHFGGLTSFVNPRLLERIDLYPGNFSARFGRKMGGIIDVGIRDPKTDGYHGMADVNLIDASFIVEGPVGKRGAFALAGKRSYIDFWFKNVIPADAIGVTAAPVYYDYQAIYTYRPESGGKVRTMFFGSGDEFRLNLKQPVDGDPTLRGSLGQGTSFRRLQTDLAAQPGRARRPGDHRRRRDDRTGSVRRCGARVQLQRLRPVPARRVARAARLARQADRRLRRLRRRAGRQLRRADLSVHGGQSALLLRPAHRPADGDVQGPVPQLPPGRLSRGADPGWASACRWCPACASTTTARSRRVRSTRA